MPPKPCGGCGTAGFAPDHGATGLAEAEATLRRLRERQAEEAAADAAMETLDAGAAGTSIADRLEAEGFGRRTKPTAASVLERLRQRATAMRRRLKPSPTPPTLLTRSLCHEPASRSNTHIL